MPDERLAVVKFDAKATPDKVQKELEKAYATAKKAITVIGAKLAPKPLAKDLPKVMAKNKKAAEFKLILAKDGKATFAVEIGDYHVPMGVGTMDKGGSDAKGNGLSEKEKANLNNRIKEFGALTVAKARSNPEIWSQARAAAKKAMTLENYDFLDAVKKKQKPKDIYDTFVSEKAKFQVNLPAAKRIDIEKQLAASKNAKADFGVAENEIIKMLEKDQFKRFRDDAIAAMKAQLKG